MFRKSTWGFALCACLLHAGASLAGDAPRMPQTPQALWSTPGDGRLVTLIKSGARYNPGKPLPAIPLRVRVCVTNMTGSANSVNLFVWTTQGPQHNPGGNPSFDPPATQPQTLHIDLGQCVDIDRPGGIVVQDATISGTASGYYQLFEETRWPVSPFPGKSGKPNHGHGFQFGEKTIDAVAVCDDIKPGPTAEFLRSCRLKLPPAKANRVCAGNAFVERKDGSYMNYAASLLELIVDPALVHQDKPSNYDYNWSPMTPMGCRDLVNVSEAFFQVGPNNNDPANAPWLPGDVKAIHVTTQTIDWQDEPH